MTDDQQTETVRRETEILAARMRSAAAELRATPDDNHPGADADAYEARLIADYLDRLIAEHYGRLVDQLERTATTDDPLFKRVRRAVLVGHPVAGEEAVERVWAEVAPLLEELSVNRLEELLDEAHDKINDLTAEVATLRAQLRDAQLDLGVCDPKPVPSSPGAPTPAEPLPAETRVLFAEASDEGATEPSCADGRHDWAYFNLQGDLFCVSCATTRAATHPPVESCDCGLRQGTHAAHEGDDHG